MKPVLPSPLSLLSRRGFLKSAALGAGALSLDARWALAQALVTGKPPKTAADIQGNGVPKGVVKLSGNENPLGASPLAIQAVSKRLFRMNRYDFGSKLSKVLAKMHGLSSEPLRVESDFDDTDDSTDSQAGHQKTGVLVGPGSEPLLHAVGVLAVAGGTGEVIESTLGYGNIARVAEKFREAGAKTNVVRVPLTRDYTHDLDAIRKAITPQTTCVVITNPNNPTGTIVAHDELVKFVDVVPPNVMVFIDEAYIHFIRKPNYQDAIDLASSRDNVIVCRTFSKVYGLAGMRIGYVVANEKIIEKMELYAEFDETVSVLGEAAAIAALGDTEFVERTKQVIAAGKDYLYKEFDTIGLPYIRSHTNFMLVDLKKENETVYRELRKRKVLVTLMGGSGWSGKWKMPTFIRVSIGTPEELEVFVAALKEVLV